MERLKKTWYKTPRTIRRPLVLIVGSLVIIAGIIMLVVPGPGWASIFLGLAIIATEFEWADRLKVTIIQRFKRFIERTRDKIKR